jgi:DNA uptake protein ComE-like DNA-binding protein
MDGHNKAQQGGTMSKMILKGILTTAVLGGLMISAAIAQTTSAAKPAASKPATAAAPAAASATAAKGDTLDINTASKADLMKLPGMTDADAAKIVAGRPYKMKSQLKGKVVSDAEYTKISDMIIAKQPPKK